MTLCHYFFSHFNRRMYPNIFFLSYTCVIYLFIYFMYLIWPYILYSPHQNFFLDFLCLLDRFTCRCPFSKIRVSCSSFNDQFLPSYILHNVPLRSSWDTDLFSVKSPYTTSQFHFVPVSPPVVTTLTHVIITCLKPKVVSPYSLVTSQNTFFFTVLDWI